MRNSNSAPPSARRPRILSTIQCNDRLGTVFANTTTSCVSMGSPASTGAGWPHSDCSASCCRRRRTPFVGSASSPDRSTLAIACSWMLRCRCCGVRLRTWPAVCFVRHGWSACAGIGATRARSTLGDVEVPTARWRSAVVFEVVDDGLQMETGWGIDAPAEDASHSGLMRTDLLDVCGADDSVVVAVGRMSVSGVQGGRVGHSAGATGSHDHDVFVDVGVGGC